MQKLGQAAGGFGRSKHFQAALSCVNILFFKGRMESKIGEANTHVITFGCLENRLMGI